MGKGGPERGIVSDRVSGISEGGDFGGQVAVAESKVSKGRNSDGVSRGPVKFHGESRASDFSRPVVDNVLAEIGDVATINSLSEPQLRAVVREAASRVLRRANPKAVSRKEVPKLGEISAEVLNGLKMVMKEGVHYKADDNGKFVTITSLGNALIGKMKLDIGVVELAKLIEGHLDEFRLGEKEMKIRGMARGEIIKVFEGRNKRLDVKRNGAREFLGKGKITGLDVEEEQSEA
ncbi:MAG: hypothetical protein Q8P62_04305 [Candidatus Peregrinibacteria bacterium]|nr:hypothetical protein [Candidatus Peregrinibacteria bacterium]